MSSNIGASSSNHPSRPSQYLSGVTYEVGEHELEEVGRREDGEGSYQTEPLLASSADVSFPHRKQRGHSPSSKFSETLKGKGKSLNAYVHFPSRHTLSRLMEHAPLALGASIALLLLFMIVVSLKRPDALLRAVGVSPNITDKGDSTPPEADASSPHDHTTNTSKHTISYAGYTSFPLTPIQYLAECYKWQRGMDRMIGGYWYVSPDGGMDVPHPEQPKNSQPGGGKTCTSTVTYMLDGYVGLSADLALMAQAAALAAEQNRTFFVNDQYWNRGKWTDHFVNVRETQPGPEPGCLPPPPEELVACPHTARHWVLDSRTAKFHFGHMFEDEYEDAYARGLRRLKPIYEHAERSFKGTIRPNHINNELIAAARAEVASGTEITWNEAGPAWEGDHSLSKAGYVGVHVRRGDRKAEAWPNVGKYVPVKEYTWFLSKAWDWLVVTESGTKEYSSAGPPPIVWLATDAPEVVEEFKEAIYNVNTADAAPRVMSLSTSSDAKLRAVASKKAYVQEEFNERPVEERVKETRGMVVDLAMVSGLWRDGEENEGGEKGDSTNLVASVCTLSSNVCKIAAVGFGWDRAFGFEGIPYNPNGLSHEESQDTVSEKHKRWIEVDDKSNIAPVWRAFEMF